MFATLNFKNGSFQIAFRSWTDFGANLSLTQSFVLGHNFPTEHPFFPGGLIRYHFLFWFQAANLEFLGLNPVWSVNLLSIISLVALLILIMTFSEILFNSRVVSRIATSLFFFSSSLSYLPFLRSQHSFGGAIRSILNADQFLSSGYPFRGDDWGALTVSVFGNQRHLISGMGLIFVVLTFLVDRYQFSRPAVKVVSSESGERGPSTKIHDGDQIGKSSSARAFRVDLMAFIFSGALIGALPYWNSAIFISALIVLAFMFLLYNFKLFTGSLLATALLIGLPQVLLLRLGNGGTQSVFHWGYTIQHPTLMLVVKYLGWTFGFRWILVLIALILLSGFHRRLFIAVSSLLAVVFLFRLSTDVFNNHKLLNVWSIFASIYAAYALWRIGKTKTIGPALAVFLTITMIFEGFIDMFPIHNDPVLSVPYENDRLTKWLLDNTQPADIFLTHTLLTHPILLTGRKVFLGYTLFAWTAGYNVAEREEIYRRMFEEMDPVELVRLLNNNNIAYIAIDDQVRCNRDIGQLNEKIYQEHFQMVFQDTENQYANLTIYRRPREELKLRDNL